MAKQNATQTKAQEAKLAKGNNVPDVHKDALEDVKAAEKKAEHVDSDNMEWLQDETNLFMDYVNEKDKNMVSSKYDHEREPKIQAGLVELQKLFPDVNPIIWLLGKWWENKASRASIKNAIDKEAQAAGIDPVIYMQNNLRDQIEPLKNMVSAIERVSYAITYFKPREAVAAKKTKPMTIDNVMYNVPIVRAEELKKEFADDLEGLKEALKEIGTIVEVETL